MTRIRAAVSQARHLSQMQIRQDIDQGVDGVTITARDRDRHEQYIHIVSVSAVFGVNAVLLRAVANSSYNARSTLGILPFQYEQYLKQYRDGARRRKG